MNSKNHHSHSFSMSKTVLASVAIILTALSSAPRVTAFRTGIHKKPGSTLLHDRSAVDTSKHRGLCAIDCTRHEYDPVCGNNNVTYHNRCEMHKQNVCQRRSQDNQIVVNHQGECAKDNRSACHEERESAIARTESSGIPIYIPVCREDGSYNEVQCHYQSGYCWCVNKDGKAVQGSSVHYGRPNCQEKDKRKRNRRRGHRGKKKRRRGKNKKRRRRRNRTCSQSDRIEFNKNVLEIISSDYRKDRSKALPIRSGDGPIGELDKTMAKWKFQQMDVNRDGFLKKRELKEFRAHIKSLSRQKHCARNLWAYCDLDGNRKLDEKEWKACLGIDINISFTLFQSLSSEEDQGYRRRDRFGRLGGHEEEQERQQEQEVVNEGSLFMPEESKESVSCWKEYSKSVNAAKNGSSGGYIPNCKMDGSFESVQCYESSGYCWCVEENTGRPITGTSVKDALPDCSRGRVSRKKKEPAKHKIIPAKPWFKCPDDKKRVFLERMMAKIKRNMGLKAHISDEEASAWQFRQLDKNLDGKLNRKEIRPFRRLLIADEEVKLCGKRIQHHCDPDDDRKVTEAEWNHCMGVAKEPSFVRVSGSSSGRRRGPNPLQTWLKAD